MDDKIRNVAEIGIPMKVGPNLTLTFTKKSTTILSSPGPPSSPLISPYNAPPSPLKTYQLPPTTVIGCEGVSNCYGSSWRG
ncbi:hypothetical protein PVL29_000417 [Vitis rotundifolia]|uniref:Uncharacterized protein n=1 Tax=Vitis rotundifolia TaxID=103349 RepID=A0AA39AIS9_VITRO|nr:hypothetical protein PVL29_000417 [Vitis rotundifolia]